MNKQMFRITVLSAFLFISSHSFSQIPADSKFAIVKMSEASGGVMGLQLNISLYFDNGEVMDCGPLLKDVKKGKILENFGQAAYILKYMESQGFELISTSMSGCGAVCMTQYVLRRKE